MTTFFPENFYIYIWAILNKWKECIENTQMAKFEAPGIKVYMTVLIF